MEEIKKIIMSCRVGSHLYGTADENSDVDYVSIFIPQEEYIVGMKRVDVIKRSTGNDHERNTKDDVDHVYYSLHKFLQLLLDNNPNIIELLFINNENLLKLEPEYVELMDNYNRFVSKKCYYTFCGYAFSQKKYLITKKERYDSLKRALDYLNTLDLYERGITEYEASKLNSILKFYKGMRGNTEHFHKGMPLMFIYSRIRTEFESYGHRVKQLSGPLENSFDRKFGYHLIRLMYEGIELLKNGRLEFPLSGKVKEQINAVKYGNMTLTELMKLYDEYKREIDYLFKSSKIRAKADFEWANQYLIKVYKQSLL